MAAKILIKRKVIEDQVPGLVELLKEMRLLTTRQKGYISGETLRRHDKPDEMMVISTWRSVDHWREWVLSDERASVQSKIDDLLGEKTEYEIYTYY